MSAAIVNREWRPHSPAQRLGRFALYFGIIAACVFSLRTVQIIPEFLYDAPEQVADLFKRMWPIEWSYYPRGVHAALIGHGMGRGDRSHGKGQRSLDLRGNEQPGPRWRGCCGDKGARHWQCRLADRQDVRRTRGNVLDCASHRPAHQQACIGGGNRRVDDLPEVGAKRGKRSGQWDFLGSDHADSPVSTSIFRNRRLTTCSPPCWAHR